MFPRTVSRGNALSAVFAWRPCNDELNGVLLISPGRGRGRTSRSSRNLLSSPLSSLLLSFAHTVADRSACRNGSSVDAGGGRSRSFLSTHARLFLTSEAEKGEGADSPPPHHTGGQPGPRLCNILANMPLLARSIHLPIHRMICLYIYLPTFQPGQSVRLPTDSPRLSILIPARRIYLPLSTHSVDRAVYQFLLWNSKLGPRTHVSIYLPTMSVNLTTILVIH